MGTKTDNALDWALKQFRKTYMDELVKWEQEGSDPQARPWWSQEDIRCLCEYPASMGWGPLGRALHEELGLIYKVRSDDRSHGYSFATPGDRARMVRYAAARQHGSLKRMAFLLEAGTAADALCALDQESLLAESLKLQDKHGITFEQIGRAIEQTDEVYARMFSAEILVLLGSGEAED